MVGVKKSSAKLVGTPLLKPRPLLLLALVPNRLSPVAESLMLLSLINARGSGGLGGVGGRGGLGGGGGCAG